MPRLDSVFKLALILLLAFTVWTYADEFKEFGNAFLEDATDYAKGIQEKMLTSAVVSDIKSASNKAEMEYENNERLFEDFFKEPEPISEKTKNIELAILKYTNAERKKQGLRELKWDSELSEVARQHSLDMADNDYFSHVNQKGEDPSARAKRNGYNAFKELGGGWYSDGVAENIGKMTTGNIVGIGYVSSDVDSIAKAQVKSWMQSSGHRDNILNSQYDTLGVGVAYDGRDYVATQNFK